MKTHAYVHKLRFRSAIYSVRCSPRIVAVALTNQIFCYNTATLELMFNVPSYPIPQGGQGPGSVNIGYGPMDVGPRWLAYVATHAFVSTSGRINPQSVSLATAPLNGSTVAHLAKESSKQIAVGIVTLGDMGYKTLTKYCSELIPDSFSPPTSGNVNWKNHTDAAVGHDSENIGTVIVRDFVSNVVVAQFRPHSIPISALCFDPSGTLLVTASINGHNLNVFRIMPYALGNGSCSTGSNVNASHIHLYKLVRGVTNAVIQDISFSDDSSSIAVSSSRGTSHLYSISPFSVVGSPHNHVSVIVDSSIGSPMVQGLTVMCPWSSPRLKGNQLPIPRHPTILSAVCKVRNGNDGWCSTISNAAAAARGKPNVSSGAVAAVFHNGGNHCLESQLGNSTIKNQLWGFSPPGHVVQYALHPNAAIDIVHYSHPEVASGSSGSIQTEDFRYEELQRWDVGRKLNMDERQDDIYELVGTSVKKERATAWAGYRNVRIHAESDGSEQLVKEDKMTEEKHSWYLSNAEVHTHQERPAIWVKPEIYFHKIMVEAAVEKGSYEEGEIEKFPTRVVEIKSKDLMPLASNVVSSNLPDASALVVNQITNGCTQTVTNGIGVGSTKIQHLNCSLNSHDSVSDFMVQTCSTSQSAFEMTNGSTFDLSNIDLNGWNQGDVSKMHAFENYPRIHGDSNILVHGHEFRKEDSVKSAGNLGVIDEDYVNGLGNHVGTNGNRTLSPDDNSDSFGSSTWDVSAEGETVSPSSVLQTTSISKQCLHEILLQCNNKSKSREVAKSVDSYGKEGSLSGGVNDEDALQNETVEDTKIEDSSVKESSSTAEDNHEDAFGGMFFCEQE
ncbi:autophagy-related protein 18h isoform X2 [Cryptomeria japonica]|nr:autophagy-related protein 18h isoform X2 [Cryptomeria japonica]